MSGPLPADQGARERFAREIGANVSLIAPAGVGKTHSIVGRIIGVAAGDNPRAMEWLPRLVVVTYTNSAAEEMRQRARLAIIASGARGAALAQFNRAFFGTIHSFCVMLLQRHGHHLGLPPGLEILEEGDIDALWQGFLRRGRWSVGSLSPAGAEALFRRVPMQEVLGLARGAPMLPSRDPGAPPGVDAGPVLGFPAKGGGKANILLGQRLVRRWMAADAAGEPYAPLPECPGDSKPFHEAWAAAFGPLRDWLGMASWAVAREIAGAFREHRLGLGRITYDDQVTLAGQLMRHPEAAAAIRAEGYRVILDEAQDTDRDQFVVLTEAAREVGASGVWMEGADGGPGPGRFAMVGDPQQSIFGRRASLASYADLRERLVADGAREISLDVTFRFRSGIADFVNRVGGQLLDGQVGQARFVPLETMGAGGRAIRWVIPRPTDEALGGAAGGRGPSEASLVRAEARELARRLRESGPGRLGATEWSGVAILCPRRRWLETMEEALAGEGLEVQNHSARESLGGSAAYAWFSALMWVMAEPRDGFEIAGVLREIFGIADADIAEFTGGDGSRLRLVDPSRDGTAGGQRSITNIQHSTSNNRQPALNDPRPRTQDPGPTTDGNGVVAETLRRLAALRSEVAAMPLRDAAQAVVDATGLRARLGSLPRDEWDPGMLDVLLMRAARAEEDGLTLAEWAESLRDGFGCARDGEAVRPGAVQLITCHKAKGLQWDCVVLPFLCRPVRPWGGGYPRVVPLGATEVPAVVFARGDLGEAREGALRRGEAQEMQRLWYVAITRSRNTLILADDREVFARRSGSFFEHSGFSGGAAAEAFDSLPIALPEAEAGRAAATADAGPAGREPLEIDWGAALRAAGEFPRRRLPHALAEAGVGPRDAEPEAALAALPAGDAPPEWTSAAADEAADYGIWWHALMEQLPWRDGLDEWRQCFEGCIASCPDRQRGEREFELFLKSDFVRSLPAAGRRFHAELPFLWRDAEWSCIEGVIDLVIWDPAHDKWIVVDWKTNRVAEGALADLAERYRPQLGAYAAAVRALAPGAREGAPVEAFLYATAPGRALAITDGI